MGAIKQKCGKKESTVKRSTSDSCATVTLYIDFVDMDANSKKASFELRTEEQFEMLRRSESRLLFISQQVSSFKTGSADSAQINAKKPTSTDKAMSTVTRHTEKNSMTDELLRSQ